MKFIDDLNRTPQDAFTGAFVFLGIGLWWAADHADKPVISVLSLVVTTTLFLGAILLVLRGRQMQGEQKQKVPVPDRPPDAK